MGLVVAGLAVWSFLDWRTGGRETGPPPVVGSSTTPATGTAGALARPTPQLPEAGVARRREEAPPPVPPVTAERRAGPIAQPDAERRPQARVEVPARSDEGQRRQPETEATRRAREERRRGEVEATRLVAGVETLARLGSLVDQRIPSLSRDGK